MKHFPRYAHGECKKAHFDPLLEAKRQTTTTKIVTEVKATKPD